MRGSPPGAASPRTDRTAGQLRPSRLCPGGRDRRRRWQARQEYPQGWIRGGSAAQVVPAVPGISGPWRTAPPPMCCKMMNQISAGSQSRRSTRTARPTARPPRLPALAAGAKAAVAADDASRRRRSATRATATMAARTGGAGSGGRDDPAAGLDVLAQDRDGAGVGVVRRGRNDVGVAQRQLGRACTTDSRAGCLRDGVGVTWGHLGVERWILPRRRL